MVLKAAERCFWVLGVLALGYCLYVGLQAAWSQLAGRYELEHELPLTAVFSTNSQARLANGAVVARLDIPRLKLSTVVFEGAGDDVLDRGAGHLAGSALPGDRGNMATELQSMRRPTMRTTLSNPPRWYNRKILTC
jgi:sortase A